MDHSLTQLNQQMLSDKFYHNQINYYKTKWINQISHDLKSPLTTIYGYSKLIQTDEASQPYVQLISEKATFMSDLIDSLNQSFDLETQQMKQDKENFPIKATVERIASIIGYQQLSLSFNLGEESQFYGNKLYFERLLINLINNSIEHNDKHPNITIRFTRESNILIIDYIDDGQGLPQPNIDALIKQSYTSKKIMLIMVWAYLLFKMLFTFMMEVLKCCLLIQAFTFISHLSINLNHIYKSQFPLKFSNGN